MYTPQQSFLKNNPTKVRPRPRAWESKGKSKGQGNGKGNSKEPGKAKSNSKRKGKGESTGLGKGICQVIGLEGKNNNALNRKNLDKLGEQSLQEKIEAAARTSEDPEQQAEVLKRGLTPDQNSQICKRDGNSLEKEEHEAKNKKGKGLSAALWLLQTEGKKFMARKSQVSALKKKSERKTFGKARKQCWASGQRVK